MIIVVEGATNAGKSTLIKGLLDLFTNSGSRCLDLNGLFSVDPVHLRLQQITHPVSELDIDPRCDGALYVAHLCRKVALLADVVKNNDYDIVFVDRLEPSVVAYCVINGWGYRHIAKMVADLVVTLPARIMIRLDCSLETMIQRSASSPLSRKDHAIAKNWQRYNEVLSAATKLLYSTMIEIDVDNASPSDVRNLCGSFIKPHL